MGAPTVNETLRKIRIIHLAMLVAMILYVFTAEVVLPHQAHDLNQIFQLGIGFVCVTILGLIVFFRTTKIRPALNTLQLKPDDPAALQQWRVGSILTAVMLETIVLFGLVLRILGAAPSISAALYIVGIGLMLLWWPQRP